MKTLSWWAIASGVIFLSLVFALPIILHWQIAQALQTTDVEKFIPDLVELELEDRRLALLTTQGLSVLSIIAGVLMLGRKRAGLYLWLGVCVAPILFSFIDFFLETSGVPLFAAAIRVAWWGIVLSVSLLTLRKPGSGDWWRKEPPVPMRGNGP